MNTLKKSTYVEVSGFIFLVVGILHGLRAFNNWEFVYNGWIIPVSWSWAIALATLYLAYSAFVLKK